MKLLRAARHKRMPWKNGGGETVEIAVFPAGAGLGDFDWRVSMATVAADGPFSIFEGVDRTLTILSGAGMALGIDGKPPVHLVSSSTPLAFSADVPVEAALIDGPITDLNVMTRRGRYAHRVERLLIDGNHTVSSAGESHILLVCDHGLRAVWNGQSTDLAPQDAFLLEDKAACALHGQGTVIAISLVRS
jgi:environmental stress-induced protein Ves